VINVDGRLQHILLIIYTADINSIKIVLVKTYLIKINSVEIIFQILDIEFNLKIILVEILLEVTRTGKNITLVIRIPDNRPDMKAWPPTPKHLCVTMP
jgi:hypothetical protein